MCCGGKIERGRHGRRRRLHWVGKISFSFWAFSFLHHVDFLVFRTPIDFVPLVRERSSCGMDREIA